jgi:methyl-accepting chemotaxis protein
VASEVRSLAQRSAGAAKEIKALIDTSVAKVNAGSRLVNEAGATMSAIVESVKRVTDIMAEIAAASQEQTTGIEQVNQAITQMDQVTQQNAALVEEAAAAAQQMQDQAATLAKVVSVFQLNGGNAPKTAVAPQAVRPRPPATPTKTRGKLAAQTAHVAPRPATPKIPVVTAQDGWEEF